MSKGVLITGGARSGKSSIGEDKAKALGENILYIATSIPYDEEMKRRIKKHIEQRPSHWITYEGYRDVGRYIINQQLTGTDYQGILIDCITVMVTNLMFDLKDINFDDIENVDFDYIERQIMKEIILLEEAVKSSKVPIIMITNEIGYGVVPESKLGREFRDIQGRVNQYIARFCDELHLVVCGVPLQIK